MLRFNRTISSRNYYFLAHQHYSEYYLYTGIIDSVYVNCKYMNKYMNVDNK